MNCKKAALNFTHQTFVEHDASEPGQAVIAPVPMHQHQALQEPEPGDGKVRRHDSLHSFLARDSHADVGRLNHADVIGTITCR